MTLTQTYVRAARYFRDDWGKVLLQFILIGAATFLSLLQAFPLAVLIDSLVGKTQPSRVECG